jgi:hypothetical protein
MNDFSAFVAAALCRHVLWFVASAPMLFVGVDPMVALRYE